MSMYKYLWIPVSGVGIWAGQQCVETYLRTYYTVRYFDKNRGYVYDDPSINQQLMRGVGIVSSIASGAITYTVFRRMIDSILLSKNPNESKLFDVIKKEEKPMLTFRKFWSLIGPKSSAVTVRELKSTYGLTLVSIFLSFGWALVVAPMIHAKSENFFAIVNEESPVWGGDRRRREEESQVVESQERRKENVEKIKQQIRENEKNNNNKDNNKDDDDDDEDE